MTALLVLAASFSFLLVAMVAAIAWAIRHSRR